METQRILSVSVVSVVEDVLQQQETRLSDIDLAWRKAEEAAGRRYEAAGWLRRTVGVVGAKDLPAEPTEEEFKLGLRNGSILCNVLNKVHPGAVPKVVENPGNSVVLPDGAALSVYQYFENIRNFLDVVQEMGLPLFEASDLEQGGKCARVVNCVLALKSYYDWKQTGGEGVWKYGGNLKPVISGKHIVRKNSEPFTNSLSRSLSSNEKFIDGLSSEQNLNGNLPNESTEVRSSRSLNMLIRAALSNKKLEEVPTLVESMLSKVVEEFERRLTSQTDLVASNGNKSLPKSDDLTELADASSEMKKMVMEDKNATQVKKKEQFQEILVVDAESEHQILKQHVIFDQQQRDIQELKNTLRTTRAGIQFMQMKYREEFSTLGRHFHSLAHAASGYQKVMEENRKLYNQLQDLKGNIRVYCRVRPFLPGQQNHLSILEHIEDGNITISTPAKYGKGRKSFNFNKVFGSSASQEEVFSDTQPLIRSVLDGFNVCIFAYGQTGSGKTYTMSGPRDATEQSLGVNYRALSDLFHISEQRKDTFCYDVSVQMIEIYNEQVRDLLAIDGLNKRLEIRNSSQKGPNVPNASLVPVASTSEVLELMNIGKRNRAMSATAMNEHSSRSHSCLTVHVQGRDMASGTILRGCMHLVDLAGSERVNKSEVTGERLKEAQHINKSLSALGDVISALAQKNSHVPYRNSKLTQLLQDSLGGQAKTLMFVHISPEVDAVGETLSTLKFAERVASVELGAARANKESGDIRELREQIAGLKAALASKGESETIQSAASSPERHRMGICRPSPTQLSRQGSTDMSDGYSDNRQPVEDVGNIEVWSDSILSSKSPNFDLQEILTSTKSSLWHETNPKINCQKAYEKESDCEGDWVDKIMVNKQETLTADDYLLRHFEEDNGQLPEFFYQRYAPGMRIHPDQQYSTQVTKRKGSHEYDIQRSRSEMGSTYDSDDLEIGTSDSSEADIQWQFNLPKVTSAACGGAPKIKKPQPKPTKSPNLRNPSQPHGPSPSRKQPNGAGQPIKRQPVSGTVDGKRSSSGGKSGIGK